MQEQSSKILPALKRWKMNVRVGVNIELEDIAVKIETQPPIKILLRIYFRCGKS